MTRLRVIDGANYSHTNFSLPNLFGLYLLSYSTFLPALQYFVVIARLLARFLELSFLMLVA